MKTFTRLFIMTAVYITYVTSQGCEENDSVFFPKQTNDYIINTPTCFIPQFYIDYENYIGLMFNSCLPRIVNVFNVHDNYIVFHINFKRIKNGTTAKCSYNFPTSPSSNATWQPFADGDITQLKEEVVHIKCNMTTKCSEIASNYSDVVQLPKKITNVLDNTVNNREKTKWNVLLVGLEAMSRNRALDNLHSVVSYFESRHWLDFRGYRKVASNSFDNINAVLNGNKKVGEVLWDAFSKAGYKTAYGEDNLIPANNTKNFIGQTKVDHRFNKSTNENSTVKCAYSPLLVYATEFAKMYKDKGFFGFFWINSVHNYTSYKIDEMLFLSFFKVLQIKGVLEKTFIIFFSDHGVPYGKIRLVPASYYDNKLPMLFMWVPEEFKKTHTEQFKYLRKNQESLITPYDLHTTIRAILQINVKGGDEYKPCSHCKDLTKPVSPDRNCAEANISERLCACDALVKVDQRNNIMKTVSFILRAYIQKSQQKLKSIIQMDWYRQGYSKYYVVRFEITPSGAVLEATIENYGQAFKVLFPIETLIPPIYTDQNLTKLQTSNSIKLDNHNNKLHIMNKEITRLKRKQRHLNSIRKKSRRRYFTKKRSAPLYFRNTWW